MPISCSGQIKAKKNDLRSARKYFTDALAIASSTKDLTPKMRAHYFLWKLAEREKNRSGELENLNEYLILKDSMKDLDLARQVERLQFEIEIERKERENELLKVNPGKTAITVGTTKTSKHDPYHRCWICQRARTHSMAKQQEAKRS
jgi:hypothetical protein